MGFLDWLGFHRYVIEREELSLYVCLFLSPKGRHDVQALVKALEPGLGIDTKRYIIFRCVIGVGSDPNANDHPATA